MQGFYFSDKFRFFIIYVLIAYRKNFSLEIFFLDLFISNY